MMLTCSGVLPTLTQFAQATVSTARGVLSRAMHSSTKAQQAVSARGIPGSPASLPPNLRFLGTSALAPKAAAAEEPARSLAARTLQTHKTAAFSSYAGEPYAPNPPPIDPYASEPDRSRLKLVTLQTKPYNAGQIPANLTTFITQLPEMFVRFNTPTPQHMQDHTLTIGKKQLTLNDLKELPTVTTTSVLQCTGNRRCEVMPLTNGLQWQAAVANVELAGYLLWDLLEKNGITPKKDSYFFAEQLDADGQRTFSTCIPLHLVPRTALLVTKMNGQPLNRDHGAPLRLHTGFTANFNVKSLSRISIISRNEIDPEKMSDYKELGDWDGAMVLSKNLHPYIEHRNNHIYFEAEPRVNSLANAPTEGLIAAKDQTEILLQGWAWSGGGREIVSVQVSTDEGNTWHDADLDCHIQQPAGERFAWTGWKINVPIQGECKRAVIRAKDRAGNIQPKQSPWNPRGVRNNSWTVVQIHRT